MFAAVYALAELESDPAVSMAEALPLFRRVGRTIADDLAARRLTAPARRAEASTAPPPTAPAPAAPAAPAHAE